MDEGLLNQIRELLQARCGLRFPPEQHIDLLMGLQKAMNASGFSNLADYLSELLLMPINSPIWKSLVQELTIGETYFFRNLYQFNALRYEVLPPLIQQRRREGNLTLRIWCAGCSTGEEPYSLAILLQELLPDLDFWNIVLLATDINERSLEKAQRGRYGSWSFRLETPPEVRDHYFAERDGAYEIYPSLRGLVRFSYLNLVEDIFPSPFTETHDMDVIICRNVTIYFDRPTTQRIVDRFYNCLQPNGWLVVGHSEPLASIYQAYQVVNFEHTVFYRKPAANSSKPTPTATSKTASPTLKTLPAFTPAPTPAPAKHLSHLEQAERMDGIYQLMSKGDLPAAQKALQALLEVMPDQVDALFLLAKLAADEGQPEAQIHEILDNIDSVDPLIPQAHVLRALLHQQSQQWSDAKNALRKALYADRQFVLAHYYMGELLYTEGNVEMAKRSWQNALNLLQRMTPSSPIPFGDGMVAGTLLHAVEQRLRGL